MLHFSTSCILVSISLSGYVWCMLERNPEKRISTEKPYFSTSNSLSLTLLPVEAYSTSTENLDSIIYHNEGNFKEDNEEKEKEEEEEKEKEGEEEEKKEEDEKEEEEEEGKRIPSSSFYGGINMRKSKFNISHHDKHSVLHLTASSKLLGEGFHRTMLTSVHISTRDMFSEEEERGGRRKALTQNGRNNQKNEREGRLRLASKEEEEEKEKKNKKKGMREKEVETETKKETRREESRNAKRMHDDKYNTRKEEEEEGEEEAVVVDVKNSRDPTTEPAVREREYEMKATSKEEEKDRNVKTITFKEEKQIEDMRENDNKEDFLHSPLVCTVTLEYSLHKIVYVDPGQTWELGLKDFTSMATGERKKKSSPRSLAEDNVHVGTVEVLASAVDLEAPVFAGYISPELHVRQRIEGVLLKKSPMKKTSSRTALSNNSDRRNQRQYVVPPTHRTTNVVDFEDLLSVDPRRKNNEEHLHNHKTQEGGKEDRVSSTQRENYNMRNKREVEEHLTYRSEELHYKIPQHPVEEENSAGYDHNCEENSRDTNTVSDTQGELLYPDCLTDRGKDTERKHFYKTSINVELPMHHRYDAACSGCHGFSLHYIETPIVKVVCCSEERKLGERENKRKPQLQRALHGEESLHATNTTDFRRNCCEQKQVSLNTEDLHRDMPLINNSEETVAAETFMSSIASSNAYCTSAESVATAVDDEQETVDVRGNSAHRRMDTDTLKSCKDPLKKEERTRKVVAHTDITHTKKPADDLDHGGYTLHQGRAESDADRRRDRCRVDIETREHGKKSTTDEQEKHFLSIQVPVGTSEDLLWVTVVTLTTISIAVILTAWILTYANTRMALTVKQE